MECRHLSLTNFRNYRRLEFDLPPGRVLLQGSNAQGKTNLLEAIYFLATSKSPRATVERELLNWEAVRQGQPAARVAGDVIRKGRRQRIELQLAGRPDALGSDGQPAVSKRIRINDIARRAVDLVGHLAVVLFSPVDVNIVDGAPAARRRYLDITNSQVDPRYLSALQRYGKVITQRNHLLRQTRERRARASELVFWDQQLTREGEYLIAQRQATIARLNEHAARIHRSLSQNETLTITYLPSAGNEAGEGLATDAWLRELGACRDREIALAQSILGPHRDDLRFSINELDVSRFGSRGQQRSVALSLKLAEAAFMTEVLGEPPVLLLDDMMSELDRGRRKRILADILPEQQVLLTATDVDEFPAEFLAHTERFTVESGILRPAGQRSAG